MANRRADGLAAIYTRLSRDPEGLRLGVERQREDLDQFSAQLGVAVVQRYEDNDIGASTRSRKRRPGYEQMLADAAGGVFATIIAYTSSRLTRRPRENEDLIELAERHGVVFRYLRSPSFDLNTADGRNIARILAANDAAESERIAERVSRAARQRAEQGHFHGGHAAFGYQLVADAAGRIVAWEPHPEHAAWVREAATRVLAGESLYGICSEWHRTGRRTGSGAVWRSRTLKRTLLSASIVGLREFEGEMHQATWEPLIERPTWDRLRTLLTDQDREIRPWPGHDTRRRYTLCGLAYCKLCGKKMASMTASKGGPAALFCSVQANGGCGRTRIAMEPLDRWVYAAFLEALADVEISPQGTPDDPDTKIRAAILADEHALEQIDADHYDGILDRASWLRQRRRISDRVEKARHALAAQTGRIARAYLPAPAEMRRQWETKDANWKRSMLAVLIQRVEIDAFPEGMAITLTRRRGETDQELADRRAHHTAAILRKRVEIIWGA